MTVSLAYHFTYETGGKSMSPVANPPSAAIAQKPLPEIISYVPADTLFFFGGLETMPVQDALKLSNPQQIQLQRAQLEKMIAADGFKKAPPAARMLIGLYVEYSKLLDQPEKLAEKVGIPRQAESALYTVGAIPVWRIKLANPEAFTAFVEAAERTGGAIAEKSEIKGVSFLTYSFAQPGSVKLDLPKLAIAQYKDYAVVSLDVSLDRERLLGLILGIDKPKKSLSSGRRLQDMQKKYGLHPAFLGYINHREIVSGLTQADANEFGRMLQAMEASLSVKSQRDCTDAASCEDVASQGGEQRHDIAGPIAAIRNPACHDELMAIADEWPQTVFGYTNLDLTGKPAKIAMRAIIENSDAAFLQDLQGLRGHIPANFLDDERTPMLGVAIGLNIDELLPFVSKIINSINQAHYQCEPLKRIQQGIAHSNPAALMAATQMLSGLRGVSFSLMNLKMASGTQTSVKGLNGKNLESFDGLITISAMNPQTLLTALGSMPSSPFAGVNIPTDGTAVPLPPLPMAPAGITAKAAIEGNNIVIYFGPESESEAGRLSQDGVQANGMFGMAMDYDKYFNMLLSATTPQAHTLDQKQLAALKDFKMKFNMLTDFTNNGVELNSNMTME